MRHPNQQIHTMFRTRRPKAASSDPYVVAKEAQRADLERLAKMQQARPLKPPGR